MAEQPPDHCINAESCDDGPPAARISFHTIDMLAEWLQTSLGDKSVAVGEALAEAFEEQARNAMGPKKPQPTPFSPPPALLELLDNLPHHMQMQQKVIHLPYVAMACSTVLTYLPYLLTLCGFVSLSSFTTTLTPATSPTPRC